MKLETRLSRLPIGKPLLIDDDTVVEARKATLTLNNLFVCSRCCFCTNEGSTGCDKTTACFAIHRRDGESVFFIKRKPLRYEKERK